MESGLSSPGLFRRKSLANLNSIKNNSNNIIDEFEFNLNSISISNSMISNHHLTSSGGLTIPLPPSSSNITFLLDGLRTQLSKRITSWQYIKSAYQGKVYWFNTVLLNQEELQAAFEHNRMKSRTVRFSVLGMSLSSLLDISAPHDFLRGLLSLMQEFDAVTDDKFERKNQRGLFKVGSRPKKGNSSGADFSMGLQESGDASYLYTPNVPFELDYFQVLYTTCDMLVETYQKMLSCLGTATISTRPPTPGGFPVPPSSSAFNGINTERSSSFSAASTSSSLLSPALIDIVQKIDVRLKKLITLLAKDVDLLARSAIKTELSLLSGGVDWSLDGTNDV